MRGSLRNLLDPVSARAREHPTRNGAIVLVVALLVIVGAVTQKVPILDSQSGYTLIGDFAKFGDVNSRTPVRVDGVNVGMVTGELAGPDPRRYAQLKMLITDHGVVLHSDATAAVRWRTVLGGPVYIDLTPGSPDAPRLHGPIPVSHTSYQVEFDDVLQIYNGSTDQAQRDMLQGLSATFDAPAGTQRSIAALPDLRTVGAGLAPYQGTEPGDLSRLVTNTAHTAQALGASVSSLQSLVTGAAQTLGAVDAQRIALGQMLALSPGTLQETNTTMARLRTTLGHLDPLVVHLEPGSQLIASMSHALRPALGQTQAALTEARPLLHSAPPTFADLHAASLAGVPILQGLMAPIARLNDSIFPWLQQRDPDTRVINYQAIGPTFSVLDKAASEYDSSGYRLHLTTLLGSASVIDESALTAGHSSLMAECLRTARPAERPNCPAVTGLLMGTLFGGQK